MAISKKPTSSPLHHQQITMFPGTFRKGNGSSGGVGKDLKQRVNICMNKLSDRDTEAMAASELEAMALDLSAHSLPSFLSAVSDTRPTDKTPLRRHSLRLLSLLSRTQPPQSLSPFLPRMVSTVLRRLRDPDSSVRSACVNAVRDMSCASCGGGASSSFYSVFLKPLSESLFLEQDHNAQVGLAMCLAAAIDEVSTVCADRDRGVCNYDLQQHLKRLVPRLVNLSKKDSFKAKGDLLSLLGSIVVAGGASTPAMLAIIIPCLAESLASDDWAVRKAAAEALTCAAAIPDPQLLSEFKTSYFSSFHARRFDKVKIVRDSMHRMLAKWKEVPGTLEDENRCGESTPPSHLQFSSVQQEYVRDLRSQAGSRVSNSERSSPLSARMNRSPVGRSSLTDGSCTPAKRNPPIINKRQIMNRKKASDEKTEINTVMSEDGQEDAKICNEILENVKTKVEAQIRTFENFEGRVRNFRVSKSRSRVIPVQEEGIPGHTLQRNGEFRDKNGDLSMIRKQLIQIETQQSSLLDLLQRFMGNSQAGICSLETRVHGIEKALVELSHDLVVSSTRKADNDLAVHCCKIPGAEFLSSKFWRRTEGRYSSMFSVIDGLPTLRVRCSRENAVNSIRREKWTFGHQGGLVVNPLAEVSPQSCEHHGCNSSEEAHAK